MYIEIKENKLLSYCEKPYLDYQFVNIDYSTFDPEKYEVKEGVLVDISSTEEYKAKVTEAEKAEKKAQLFAQISELDLKSIRAMRENEIKDEATGQTWLEHYTLKIQELRAELAEL